MPRHEQAGKGKEKLNADAVGGGSRLKMMEHDHYYEHEAEQVQFADPLFLCHLFPLL